MLQKWVLAVNIWKFTVGLWQSNPESSQFMQELRCVGFTVPQQSRAVSVASPALQSGLHVLLYQPGLVFHGQPQVRSVLLQFTNAQIFVMVWITAKPQPASFEGGKSLFLLHKGAHTGREVGAVAQHKSALEIKALLQWWLISLHNSPLDVLDTNMLFLL